MATEILLSPPPNGDTVLWRYMPDENFYPLLVAQSGIDDWAELPGTFPAATISLPSLGSFRLSLPKAFSDEHEGTFPALNSSNITYCANAGVLLGVPPAEQLQRAESFCERNPAELRDRVQTTALLHGVSCWTTKCDESLHMWNSFARRKDGVVRGVAIRTTCRKLREAVVLPSLHSPVQEGKVRLTVNCPKTDFDRLLFEIVTVTYVDLDRDFLLPDGARNLLRLKGREHYVDESEVRCIGLSPALASLYRKRLFCSDPSLDELKDALKNVSSSRRGYCLPIKLQHAIEEIRTFPAGDTSFFEDVSARTAAKGIRPALVHPSVF